MPPQRLPLVNGDDGVWGDIIRQYLMKEHYNDDTNNAANGGHHKITIRAGTATAGTAPLKFTSGTLLTTPEAGAIEFNADKLYFTKTTGPTRQTVATYDVTGSTGDLYYRDSSSNFTRLPIGSANNVLTVSGGLPAWAAPAVTSTFSDASFTLQDDGDATKQVQFQLNGLSTATTRTITVPNSNGTMYVTGGTDVSVADGGTGRSTSTTAYGIIAAGTTATGAQQTIAPGTAGQFLKSAGASALASFASLQLSDLSDASTVATLTGSQTLTGKTISLANNTITGTTAQFNTALSDGDFATAADLANKADVSHKYHTFTNGDYYFDDYSHSRYLRLFTENPTYTTTRFKTPVEVEYHDGTNWVTWAGGDTEIKKLLDGREETQSSIDHTHRRFRFKLLANTYPLQTLWLVQTSWTGITFPGVTMKVATSTTQGGTYTLRDTATFNSGNGSTTWGMSVYATSTLHVSEPWYQIEIEWTDWTDNGSYTTAPMRRIEILSNYQGGSLLPFSWNWDKQLSGLNKLALPTGTTNSIGIDFGTDTNLYRSAANQLSTDDNLIIGSPGTIAGSAATIDGTQTLTNKTLTTPVINGVPTGTGVATAPTASTLVLRDTNGNVSANAFVHGFTTTATAAGTTTLTITSDSIQEFTGTSTQTVRLPTTSIVAGARYTVINSSTGAVTVQSSGANTISTLPSGTSATFTALVATPTTAANWESTYINTGDTSSNTSTSVDGEVALFSGTGGKTIKRATGSGIAKLTSGVLSTATAGTDYVTPTGTETLSSKTLTSPVINGTVTGTAVATAATANLLAKWDANKNLFADNFIATYTTTATAAGTTTLTVASTQIQVFTGTSTQTVVLPTTSIVAGTQYRIINNSTGAVTVQSSALNTITVLAGNTSGLFTALQAAPTANTHWDGQYWGTAVGGGKTLAVSNSLTLAGTDGTTMTFPNASGNVVTEGATQTLTGKTLSSPTFTGSYSFGGTPTWPTFNQNTTGSAATLTTARTIGLSGGATGTATSFNGSANITIPVTALNADNLSAGTLPDARMTGTYTGFTHRIDGANTVFTTPNTGSTNTLGRTVYGLAEYRSNSATQVGAIIFYAPNTTSSIMHQLEVSGLLYNQNIVQLTVQGYRTTGAWNDTRKISTGTVDVQVRWGVDPSGKNCLILGDVGTSWAYPHFSVVRAMFSHTGAGDAYATGWTVGVVTDLTGYTQITSDIANSAMIGNIAGNAATATALQTARTIGGVSFNGTANINLPGVNTTGNQNTTGSAATLTTARTVQTNLASTASASFNGSADITPGVTGTLPVGNGGTGATTLTGLVKGNGTSAMTAATAGTDYVTPTGTETLSGKTLTSPVINGTVTGTGVASAPTASTLVLRDANGNVSANAFVHGFTTTATAAGTTTLTITSDSIQEFTGTTTQTVRLPTTSIVAGARYTVINSSTGIVTVQSSGANTVSALPSGTSATFTALVATPTTAANWESTYVAAGGDASTNTATSVDNEVVLFSGTGGKTLKRATTTGIAKLTSGVLSAATAGTDYVTPAGTETLSSKTLTSPVINGTVTGTGVATAATANLIPKWDANKNLFADNFIATYTTTATAAGTTTLTVASTQIQVFTGTSTQTVTLPTTSVVAGTQYRIINNSTGAVTVNASGGTTAVVLAANTSALVTALQATPTTNAHWDTQYWGTAVGSGKTLVASNSLTLAGTDGTTMTFPSASGNVVTEAATQTLTGKTLSSPTFSGSYSFGGTPTWPTFNQNTTGSAATLTTTRTLTTNLASTTAANFNGSANASIGVTGTLPVANGGTGRATATTAYGLIAAGTTATGAQQTIAPGTAGQFLKSAGASALAAFASITATDISDSTATGRSVLTATDATAARSAIGAGDVTLSGTQSLTNKTIAGTTNTITVADANFTIQDEADTTKTVKFSVGGLPTGATLNLNTPNVTGGTHTLVSRNSTDTMLNKRIEPRVLAITSSATPTINTDDYDFVKITALATNITSMTTNLTGTPEDGEKIMFRIKDNGTPRTISWGASFQASGVATPLTTTSASKEHHILFVYSATVAKWVCLAVDSVGY